MSAADQVSAGRALRKVLPRRDHAAPPSGDRDAVAILEEQNATRLPELVPVRMGRMLQSPFALYRGSAAVMAGDLARGPATGPQVVACGDAHIANFGLFASPERALLFDLNDFDEAGDAPWEWDVKRLAASVVIGARDLGMDDSAARDAAVEAVGSYRLRLARLVEATALDRFYFQVDADAIAQLARGSDRAEVERTLRKARSRTSEKVLRKITVEGAGGERRIADEPPILRHIAPPAEGAMERIVAAYLRTVRSDVAQLLSKFRLVDQALRVVGVGSVGTRCHILLFLGPADEPLVLQAKEAGTSVLESHGGSRWRPPGGARPRRGREGFRVVSCQRILQAASDPFLGWVQHDGRDYYVRQFRDMKGSFEISGLSPSQFARYGALCGALLARAHSQSSAPGVIAAYLGRSTRFDEAVADWSIAYADLVERDHDALAAAVRAGRVPVETGV
ncbi:MAG: DUF2252 domain-containing protein [Thermoleophilia bacterium]